MEFINNVFLLLALSSLFSSANAVCLPRNVSNLGSISIPPLTQPLEPPQVAPQATPVTETPPQVAPQATPVTVSPPQSSPQATPATVSTPQSAPQETPVTVSPPQSPSPEVNSAPAEEESGSEEDSGIPVFHKLHSNNLVSSVASVTTDLVEICDVTSNPELCKTSISSHMHGSTVDPTSALKTEIEQSIAEVTKGIATLQTLRKDTAASNAEIACYDTCLENFDMAIEDLKSGLESIDVHDVGRMETVLTAVLTDLMTCDDTFAEMGVDSPLDNLSMKMNKYASNCLAISKLLL